MQITQEQREELTLSRGEKLKRPGVGVEDDLFLEFLFFFRRFFFGIFVLC
jgi:hypothetical protein